MRAKTEAHAYREDSAGIPGMGSTHSYHHAPAQGGRGGSRADRPRTSQHRTWRRDEGAAGDESARDNRRDTRVPTQTTGLRKFGLERGLTRHEQGPGQDMEGGEGHTLRRKPWSGTGGAAHPEGETDHTSASTHPIGMQRSLQRQRIHRSPDLLGAHTGDAWDDGMFGAGSRGAWEDGGMARARASQRTTRPWQIARSKRRTGMRIRWDGGLTPK